ncbi:hypothetical protein EDB89DRAFT_1913720 [Lactarius sanguifluus]|nr:hypothetical protein EDB89DRAFT_1913720 [Lactarius sanguifluus]
MTQRRRLQHVQQQVDGDNCNGDNDSDNGGCCRCCFEFIAIIATAVAVGHWEVVADLGNPSNQLRTFDRTNVPALRQLLGNPNKPSDLYPLWSRLLFPNQDTHSTRPFQSMLLVRCLRLILFGPSPIDGESAVKRTMKGVLWGVKKTTLGMIATAATLLIYACSQDQSFTRTRGQSGIAWKEHFELYKQTIIRFPVGYHTELLSWFDKLLFKNLSAASGSSSGTGSLTGNQGHREVEDIIERVNQAVITSSPPAHVAQPVDADNHDPTPISHAQSPSSDGALAPSPGQMEQPPKDTRTTNQVEELTEDDHEQNIAAC